METIEKQMTEVLLFKKDNNLDGKDNLDSLPPGKAIYGLFGRINGRPANCRFIGTTENLREAVKHHFSDRETKVCLRTFMQSIKIKFLVYQPLTNEKPADIEGIQMDWEQKFKPDCNDELNRIH